MDPGSLPLSVRAVILCLLGAARCSSADNSKCNCSKIPHLPLTKPPPETCNETFRYTCEDGYTRKVGTSNFIKCNGNNNSARNWTTASLICIPDPRRTITLPPKIPVTSDAIILAETNRVWSSAASFTDFRMTESGSFSSTGVLEKNRLKPTSLDLQIDQSQATDWTTPASSNEPPNNRKDNFHLSSNRLGTTATALSVCASLVIVCALMGISYVCYRRKSQRYDRPATDEEKISMSQVPAEPAS